MASTSLSASSCVSRPSSAIDLLMSVLVMPLARIWRSFASENLGICYSGLLLGLKVSIAWSLVIACHSMYCSIYWTLFNPDFYISSGMFIQAKCSYFWLKIFSIRAFIVKTLLTPRITTGSLSFSSGCICFFSLPWLDHCLIALAWRLDLK